MRSNVGLSSTFFLGLDLLNLLKVPRKFVLFEFPEVSNAVRLEFRLVNGFREPLHVLLYFRLGTRSSNRRSGAVVLIDV